MFWNDGGEKRRPGGRTCVIGMWMSPLYHLESFNQLTAKLQCNEDLCVGTVLFFNYYSPPYDACLNNSDWNMQWLDNTKRMEIKRRQGLKKLWPTWLSPTSSPSCFLTLSFLFLSIIYLFLPSIPCLGYIFMPAHFNCLPARLASLSPRFSPTSGC